MSALVTVLRTFIQAFHARHHTIVREPKYSQVWSSEPHKPRYLCFSPFLTPRLGRCATSDQWDERFPDRLPRAKPTQLGGLDRKRRG